MPIFLLREILIFMYLEIVQTVKNNIYICYSDLLIKLQKAGRVSFLSFHTSWRIGPNKVSGVSRDELVCPSGKVNPSVATAKP